MSKIYLNVGYDEKDEVKKLGAKFDWNETMWYTDSKNGEVKFAKWIPKKIEIKEIKTKGCQIIPMCKPKKSLKNVLSVSVYNEVKKFITNKEICEFCGESGKELGEMYNIFDETQKLSDLKCLCAQCLPILNINLHYKKDSYDALIERFTEFSGLEKKPVQSLISQAFELNKVKIERYDFSLVEKDGIEVKDIEMPKFENITLGDLPPNGYFNFNIKDFITLDEMIDFTKELYEDFEEICKISYCDNGTFLIYCYFEEKPTKLASKFIDKLKYSNELEYRSCENKKPLYTFDAFKIKPRINKDDDEDFDISDEIYKKLSLKCKTIS
jgi:hypothetical protein